MLLNTACATSIAVSKIESESFNGCLTLPNLKPGGGCCSSQDIVTDCTALTRTRNLFYSCRCDQDCYYANDCCTDILKIGCVGKHMHAWISINVRLTLFWGAFIVGITLGQKSNFLHLCIQGNLTLAQC